MLADGADRAGGVEVGWRITLSEEGAELKLGERERGRGTSYVDKMCMYITAV